MAATEDSMDDDVFEVEEDAKDKLRTGDRKLPKVPSPTGYRGYKPPLEVIKLAQNDIFEDTDQKTHKVMSLFRNELFFTMWIVWLHSSFSYRMKGYAKFVWWHEKWSHLKVYPKNKHENWRILEKIQITMKFSK